MLIEGKFRTFGFWLSACFLVFSLFLAFNFIPHFKGMNWKGVFYISLVLGVSLGTFGRLLFDAHYIEIDTIYKTVQFKNRFTFKRTTYHFSDFDGKLICYEPISWGYVRNLYFIKDRKAVKKLTTLMYSNQAELEENLEEIKDLGSFEYSYIKTWKISLGLPIID